MNRKFYCYFVSVLLTVICACSTDPDGVTGGEHRPDSVVRDFTMDDDEPTYRQHIDSHFYDYQGTGQPTGKKQWSPSVPIARTDRRTDRCDTRSYCTSGGENCTEEWIESVQIGGQTHVSGRPTSAFGYTDWTGTRFELSQTAHSVVLTPGFGGASYPEYFRVWIDFNRDGNFSDSGERVFDARAADSAPTVGTLDLSGAPALETRMRVVMRYADAPNACGNYAWGETEDYTVLIGQPTYNHIVYTQTESPSWGGDIYLVSDTGQERIPLAVSADLEFFEGVIGDRLIYTRYVASSRFEIYSVGLDGTDVRLLTPGDETFSFVAIAGERVIMAKNWDNHTGDGDFHSVRVDGTDHRVLVERFADPHNPGRIIIPRLAAVVGDYMIYTLYEFGYDADLHTVKIDGSEHGIIAAATGHEYFEGSFQDRWVIFTHEDGTDSNLYSQQNDGGYDRPFILSKTAGKYETLGGIGKDHIYIQYEWGENDLDIHQCDIRGNNRRYLATSYDNEEFQGESQGRVVYKKANQLISTTVSGTDPITLVPAVEEMIWDLFIMDGQVVYTDGGFHALHLNSVPITGGPILSLFRPLSIYDKERIRIDPIPGRVIVESRSSVHQTMDISSVCPKSAQAWDIGQTAYTEAYMCTTSTRYVFGRIDDNWDLLSTTHRGTDETDVARSNEDDLCAPGVHGQPVAIP